MFTLNNATGKGRGKQTFHTVTLTAARANLGIYNKSRLQGEEKENQGTCTMLFMKISSHKTANKPAVWYSSRKLKHESVDEILTFEVIGK